MNAYVKFQRYKQDFYTDANAHSVKGDGTVYLDSALRNCGAKSQGGTLQKTLDEGQAMYLYGGKKALVFEFTEFKKSDGDFVLIPPNNCNLSVYHGKVTVKTKTKRILMILSYPTSRVPNAVSDRRLIVDLYDYQVAAPGKTNWGFYTHLDLAGLERLVRAIPKD